MHRSTLLPLVAGGLALLALAGAAGAQSPPVNVTLLSHIEHPEQSAGNWGYTAPDGTELAITCTIAGTWFIDATDPANAQELIFIPGAPSAFWRECATYGEYCYIVTDLNGGAALQIVSLAEPLLPVLVAELNPPLVPYSSAHEIKIDQQTGICYIAGADGLVEDKMVILDLNDNLPNGPTLPKVLGTWTENYVHDLSILDGKAYIASIYDGLVYTLDVTQPGTPTSIAPPWSYPGAFTHNTWPSADGHYLVTTDETAGGHLRLWDISNLNQPEQTGEFDPPTSSIVHNAYIRGRYCFMSHYQDGLRVVDISDPYNLESVGWYDTHPGSSSGFAGAWGCYCFATDPNIVYISDMETGTYILRFDPPATGMAEQDASPGARPRLLGNFPNPFHPSTAIRFEMASAAPVQLRIYDASGRLVRSLLDRPVGAGIQSVAWNGLDETSRPVASGVYYYRLETPGFTESRSMLVAP
jgi:choice-of-anchor B domain-containing protein